MTNTFFDLRRCLLLLLLLWLPRSVQNGVETNAGENLQAAHVKTGPRSLMSRDLLSATSADPTQDFSFEFLLFVSVQESELVHMDITSDEEDRPRNADEALATTLQQNVEGIPLFHTSRTRNKICQMTIFNNTYVVLCY